jgi:hypothetical protein
MADRVLQNRIEGHGTISHVVSGGQSHNSAPYRGKASVGFLTRPNRTRGSGKGSSLAESYPVAANEFSVR